MIRFKQFIEESKKKSDKPTIITAEPMHGGHSRRNDKPTMITAEPMHGGHSRRRRNNVKEDFGVHGPFHPDKSNDNHVRSYDWEEHNSNKHLGKHVDDVHDKLNMSKDEWEAHPHHDHLYKYSASSWDVNHALIKKANGEEPFKRTNFYTDEEHAHVIKKHHKHVEKLDHALKHRKLEHDLHVYHGTSRWNPGEEAAKNSKNEIHLPAYTSTSIDRSKAIRFSGRGHGSHVIHIHLKKGQHGAYLGSHSDFQHEREFLLPRDTKLKIHPEPTKLSDNTHVWHAHVVHD